MSLYDHGGKPINKLAAMVVSGGEHYEPKAKTAVLHFENMPELPELPNTYSLKVQLAAMIGKRQGRLVVVAWWGSGKSTGKKAAWLCRCDCGEFTVRAARAINNPKNAGDRCYKCMDFYCSNGEVFLVRGRLKFGGCKNSAPFPSAVVVFRPNVADAFGD